MLWPKMLGPAKRFPRDPADGRPKLLANLSDFRGPENAYLNLDHSPLYQQEWVRLDRSSVFRLFT